MKKRLSILCVLATLTAMLVGCGSDDTHTILSCADVVSAYEEAGYEVWHQEYAEEEREYLCEIAAENDDGDSIHFRFFDSKEQAEEYAKERKWNVLLWAYAAVSGDPTWLYTEVYDTIEIEYDNKDLYKPFQELS